MGDVTPAAGVLLSVAAAREVAAALDELDRLAKPRGQRLNARLAQIRSALVCTTAARADTSAEDVVAQEIRQWEPTVVDTAAAARMLGITPGGVTWLCRNGRLTATRVGGRWLVDTAALRVYERRKEW